MFEGQFIYKRIFFIRRDLSYVRGTFYKLGNIVFYQGGTYQTFEGHSLNKRNIFFLLRRDPSYVRGSFDK